jgi:dephospho-CoA kinase
MIVIGVTGGMGTGKSFVAAELGSLGAKVLDADNMAHECLKRGTVTYKKIVKVFGKRILDGRGSIDRKKLAAVVFDSRKEIQKLNSIIHPDVVRRIKGIISSTRKHEAVVIDAPLLVEAKLTGLVDKLIVVTASRKNQYCRSAHRLGIGKEECERRLKNQMPLSRKMKMADFVIRNNGTKEMCRNRLRRVWAKLWR